MQLIRPKQLSERTGISYQNILIFIRKGIIPAKKLGKSYYITASTVNQLIQGGGYDNK